MLEFGLFGSRPNISWSPASLFVYEYNECKFCLRVRFMNSLSFCENKYYTNTAISNQFSENCSQFPRIHNATRGKGRGQHTHKSTSLSDNCSWFPAWCSWPFIVKQIRSFKWSYYFENFVKRANFRGFPTTRKTSFGGATRIIIASKLTCNVSLRYLSE